MPLSFQLLMMPMAIIAMLITGTLSSSSSSSAYYSPPLSEDDYKEQYGSYSNNTYATVASSWNWMTGIVHCPSDGNLLWAEDCDYVLVPGVITIGSVAVANFDTCGLSCNVNSRCNLFSYDPSRFVCYLGHSDDPQVKPTANNYGMCGYIIASTQQHQPPYYYY